MAIPWQSRNKGHDILSTEIYRMNFLTGPAPKVLNVDERGNILGTIMVGPVEKFHPVTLMGRLFKLKLFCNLSFENCNAFL